MYIYQYIDIFEKKRKKTAQPSRKIRLYILNQKTATQTRQRPRLMTPNIGGWSIAINIE